MSYQARRHRPLDSLTVYLVSLSHDSLRPIANDANSRTDSEVPFRKAKTTQDGCHTHIPHCILGAVSRRLLASVWAIKCMLSYNLELPSEVCGSRYTWKQT
jgi:hypothetical protein